MRVMIKSFSARSASPADEDSQIFSGSDCREIVESMRALAPFSGCRTIESYMRWTLRQITGTGGSGEIEIEGETPLSKAESFLALLGELGLAEFLPDEQASLSSQQQEEKGPVMVPEDVLAGIEAVRMEGKTNMLDYKAVIRLAREACHHAAAYWIESNVSLYSKGFFFGFSAKKTGGEG